MNMKVLRSSISLALLAAALVAAPRFTDVTAQAGIRFTHNSGKAGKKWLPETMGAGCAWFDFDNDGCPTSFW